MQKRLAPRSRAMMQSGCFTDAVAEGSGASREVSFQVSRQIINASSLHLSQISLIYLIRLKRIRGEVMCHFSRAQLLCSN